MSEIRTSLVVNLAGNLTQRSQRYSRALEDMSKRGQRHMGLLKRSVHGLGQGLDRIGNRYTAIFTGAGGALAARQVMALETRFERLGIQANKSQDEMNKLKQTIFDVAQEREIRVDPSQITGAIEAIVEKTGDLQFAENNIRNIGLAIQATGAEGKAIGEIMAEFQKMGMIDPKEIMATLDTLNVQGKEGAFTLQNLAALGPRVITAYTATGRSGAQAMREMGAALQMIRQGTGSSEMAASAFEATMRTLTDPKKIKMLERAGLAIFDPEAAKNGQKVLRPINELMTEIIQKVNGDAAKLGQVFDAEAMRAFNAAAAEFQRTGGLESLQKFMSVNGDGTTTMRDAARAASTSEAALQNLYTAWQQFQDSQLAGPIQDAADALNSLEPGTVQRWLEIGKNIALVGGGLIALRKAGQAVGWLKGIASGAKAGGIGGALSGAAGMGVTPVYVTNMQGAGMGGLPTSGSKGGIPPIRTPKTVSNIRAAAGLLAGTDLKKLPMYGAAALGTAGIATGAAGAAGYGVGSLIYDKALAGTEASDSIGRSIAKALAFFGNDNAQAALDAERRTQEMRGQLKIEVEDKRISVRSASAENIDFDVSGTSLAGP